jgi:hypothetical protein
MARNAVPMRTAPGLVVHDDQQALRDYTRGNLTSYWEPTLDKVATAVESLPEEQVLDEFIVPWCTLGVARLHASLVTGEIVSKTAARQHGAVAFPQWAALCERCIDHRAGDVQQFTVADAKESVAFGRAVIAAALELQPYGRPATHTQVGSGTFGKRLPSTCVCVGVRSLSPMSERCAWTWPSLCR